MLVILRLWQIHLILTRANLRFGLNIPLSGISNVSSEWIYLIAAAEWMWGQSSWCRMRWCVQNELFFGNCYLASVGYRTSLRKSPYDAGHSTTGPFLKIYNYTINNTYLNTFCQLYRSKHTFWVIITYSHYLRIFKVLFRIPLSGHPLRLIGHPFRLFEHSLIFFD